MESAAPTSTPPSVDVGLFRHVVGHLASGVTVLTTATDGRRHGMTASSVTSLSMDPPLMLACINNAAPTADAVTEAGTYAVNVLGEHQGELARQFATASQDKFRGVSVRTGELDVPLLGDALAQIECEVVERVVGGTHTIFVGRVVSATAGDGQPLTYFRGGFGRFEFARDDEVYGRARRPDPGPGLPRRPHPGPAGPGPPARGRRRGRVLRVDPVVVGRAGPPRPRPGIRRLRLRRPHLRRDLRRPAGDRARRHLAGHAAGDARGGQ